MKFKKMLDISNVLGRAIVQQDREIIEALLKTAEKSGEYELKILVNDVELNVSKLDDSIEYFLKLETSEKIKELVNQKFDVIDEMLDNFKKELIKNMEVLND